jgi:hypothetical protein
MPKSMPARRFTEELTNDCLSGIEWTLTDPTGTNAFSETLGSLNSDVAVMPAHTFSVSGAISHCRFHAGRHEQHVWLGMFPPDHLRFDRGCRSTGAPARRGANRDPRCRDAYTFTAAPGAAIYFDAKITIASHRLDGDASKRVAPPFDQNFEDWLREDVGARVDFRGTIN